MRKLSGFPSIMKFSFKNLGSLEAGEIEIKPLTILCGASNTGKTYAMYALAGIFGLRNFKTVPFLKRELEHLQATGLVEIDLQRVLTENWQELERRVAESLQANLPTFFSADSSLFEHTRLGISCEIGLALRTVARTPIDQVAEAPGGKTLLNLTKEAGSMILKVSQTGKLPLTVVEERISNILGQSCLAPWGGQVYLLPSERAGLNLFYRELNRQRTALLHHATKPQIDLGALFRDMVARYPQPIADYIDLLNDLSNAKRRKGIYHSVAQDLQKDLLGIKKYAIDKDGNIQFTPKRSDSSLSLHLGSSTVKSLFGLWLYLENISQVGDVLMIDEPELNLHPAHQRIMANIVARLVNSETKVLITTHSDYFVRQINNLLMLGNGGDKGRESASRHKYPADHLLVSAQVGAYLFKGGTVTPMEIDDSEGILADTFDDVIRDLNLDSQEIYMETQE